MTKKNCTIIYIKCVDGLRDITSFNRTYLFSLLLLVSLNQIKAQSPDVITEDINFESLGVNLAGTIYRPQHSHAAVVLVHGSGQTPRMRKSIERLNALKAQGKPYEYCLFSTLGHKIVLSDFTEPIEIAIHWIKDRKYYMRNK